MKLDDMAEALTPTEQKTLSAYKRRLWLLILLSAGIDSLIFFFEVPIIVTFFGASLVVDEIVEYFVSNLLAKNKMRLKKRFKIFGFLPIPGVTSLSIQAVLELWRSWRRPEKILHNLAEAEAEKALESAA